ncbi:MAG: NUDIX hydrolase [Muribaculaceae bacterium]|nr:NUDIX hydrolase [Muribaculaceae bacterium]
MNQDKITYSESYNDRYYDSERKEYAYRYPHAALTADCVIFGFDGKNLKILLIERGLEPYKGMWALPGGFMKIADPKNGSFDKTIEETAQRELKEETNLSGVFMQQFKVFSRFDRDPRERVITVAFIALIGPQKYRKVVEQTMAGDDAANALWWNEDMLPPMAFDHAEIIKEAKEYLAELIRIKPVAFNLLDDTFSMTELQNVYEAITGQTYDRRNFQRKALQTGLLDEVKTGNVAAGFMPESNNNYSIESDSCLCETVPYNEDEERPRRISPRKRKKFFSFRNEGKKPESSDNEEGSIKDIFNF